MDSVLYAKEEGIIHSLNVLLLYSNAFPLHINDFFISLLSFGELFLQDNWIGCNRTGGTANPQLFSDGLNFNLENRGVATKEFWNFMPHKHYFQAITRHIQSIKR